MIIDSNMLLIVSWQGEDRPYEAGQRCLSRGGGSASHSEPVDMLCEGGVRVGVGTSICTAV